MVALPLPLLGSSVGVPLHWFSNRLYSQFVYLKETIKIDNYFKDSQVFGTAAPRNSLNIYVSRNVAVALLPLLTWTCGGVPRTYITESATSLAAKIGRSLYNSSSSFGIPDASAISVFTPPGLMLYEEKSCFISAKHSVKQFVLKYGTTSMIETNYRTEHCRLLGCYPGHRWGEYNFAPAGTLPPLGPWAHGQSPFRLT
jgi:hypothetical protein